MKKHNQLNTTTISPSLRKTKSYPTSHISPLFYLKLDFHPMQMSHVVCNNNSFPSPKVTQTMFLTFSISFLFFLLVVVLLHRNSTFLVSSFLHFFSQLYDYATTRRALQSHQIHLLQLHLIQFATCDGGYGKAHCVGNGSSRTRGGWDD